MAFVNRIHMVVLVLLSLSLLVLWRMYGSEKAERTRLDSNQRVLMEGMEHFRTKDSLSAIRIERLQLTEREFSRYCQDLEEKVRSLKIKINQLKSVSETATEVRYEVRTVLRDSVLPGAVDTVRCLDYRNNYLAFSGCLEGKNFSGTITGRDTLTQVVYRVPRKFLFVRWGTKAIRQEIVSANPYTQLVYSTYVEIKK